MSDKPTINCPALFITAPASSQGKTTVTAALARLHSRQGRRVQVFKCGPDFLDPQILAAASGQAVYNLDLWMCGQQDGAARLASAAANADLLLIEGSMGLFDGQPSSAEIARCFGVPVLAVIDASGMAQTFGAIAYGLKHYKEDLPFGGVLANRVGSARHVETLREGLPADITFYGHLPRDTETTLPQRHLGLIQAAEIDNLTERLDRLANLLADTPSANLPPPVTFGAMQVKQPAPLLAGYSIAIARDAAFSFIYRANIDCLRALGAELIYFSPLTDNKLPDCDAIWLPGGYPELYAARLAKNDSMLAALQKHYIENKPILAECGGMMALFDVLLDRDGASHQLAGLLPGTTAMQPRLAALGLQEAMLPEGQLRGHTFHYSKAVTDLAPLTRAKSAKGQPGEAVYRSSRLTASYVHFYFPYSPETVARLFLP